MIQGTDMIEPQRAQRTQRQENLRYFLVLLRTFFLSWDAPLDFRFGILDLPITQYCYFSGDFKA
ncbi:hypothetical protein [Sphaerospermopsis sp. LEGE 08334]|jgi:hypothetical protein|uniref:hypothetical protein n=1 Tax=Sphaerospermopsis sp. LEGE 08334 TaxID=1828651 RepID=UPI00187E4544|nr:hypothetical protein [Sphaerospermopsis sp. LEGE 08334]MBE9054945.1 hypothetical protein [Sphaerospermopsis sp. LEGE 08334]